jgi:hypothetical protein
MTRRRVAAGLGVAGLVQATLGAVIPDWTGHKLARVALVLLGTTPLAVAGWFALVPVLVAAVALPSAAVVLRSRPTEPIPNTGKDV